MQQDCQVAGMHARAAGRVDHHGDDSRRIGHVGLVIGGALAKHGHLARAYWPGLRESVVVA